MEVRIDTLISELNSFGILSVRAVNICLDQNMHQVIDLLKYYMSGGSFRKIRNCGLKTQLELDNFCSQYEYLISEFEFEGEKALEMTSPDLVVPYINVDVKRLSKIHRWSRSTINFCRSNGISDLNDLLRFAEEGKLFHGFKFIGTNAKIELGETINYYKQFEQSPMRNRISDRDLNISITELSLIHNWSIRTTNCCLIQGISDLGGILDYFNKNHSFLSMKNCGRKTNIELTETVQFYNLESIRNRSALAEVIGLQEILNRQVLSIQEGQNISRRVKKVLFERKIFTIIDCYKFRDKMNVEGDFTDNEVDSFIHLVVENYSEAISLYRLMNSELFEAKGSTVCLFPDPNLVDSLLKVASDKCIYLTELADFQSIKSRFEDRHLLQLITCFLADLNTRIDYDSHFNLYLRYVSDSGFCIFSFLKFYIFRNKALSLVQSRIFSFIASVNNEEINMQDLGDEFGLSRERIRQLREKSLLKITRELQVVSSVLSSGILINNYLKSDPIIHVGHEFSDLVNSAENTQFNCAFVAMVLSKLCNREYDLVVFQDEDLVSPNWRDKLFKYGKFEFYLIRSDLLSRFSVRKFMDEIKERRKRARISNQNIDLKYFLKSLIDSNDFVDNDIILSATIMAERFDGVFISDNDLLVFETGLKEVLKLAIVETMQFAEEPMSLTDIQEELKMKMPSQSISLAIIRRAMRDRTVFVSYGLSGYYGLFNWDLKGIDAKFKNIVKLVEEFLTSCQSPQHISVILSNVLPARITTARSIQAMIRMDRGSVFITYGGGYYGLSNVHVNRTEFFVNPIVGSHFHTDVLRRFNGWKFTEVIKVIASDNGYYAEQVRFVLNEKLRKGVCSVDDKGLFNVELSKSNRETNLSNSRLVGMDSHRFDDDCLDSDLLDLVLPLIRDGHFLRAIEVASIYYNERGVNYGFVELKNLMDTVRFNIQ
jgi:hypothetical protein